MEISAFNFIESLIFRYVVICQKDENKLLEKFYFLAKQITDKSVDTMTKFKTELSEFIIDDGKIQIFICISFNWIFKREKRPNCKIYFIN